MPDFRFSPVRRAAFPAAFLIAVATMAHAAPVTTPPASLPDYGVIRLVSETLPVPPRSPFSDTPETIQSADTGLSLAGGLLHQHYVEDQVGKTLDTEHGSIPFLRLAWRGQYDHFGWGAVLRYATGSDHYDGALQSCTASSCTLTPTTSSTGNKILDLTLNADYGFSPLPHLAVMPGLFVGQHVWLRDLHGVGGYDERYSHRQAGVELGVQYSLDRFVLGLRGRYGTTFSPHLISTISSARFNLGSSAYSSVRLRLTWAATSRIHLFIGDEYSGFGYGASQQVPVGNGLALREPHSRTQQNAIEIGVMVR